MSKNISNEQFKLLAKKVNNLILANKNREVVKILKPLLDSKYPFPKLDFLGREIGQAGINEPHQCLKIFDEIINYNAMGGFVIVGQGLIPFLEKDFEAVMQKSREYIIKGDEWYVCDIIGERSLGQALVDYFDKTCIWIKKFLQDENKWVKRSAGVAVHFFSKRVLDKPEKTEKLLMLIEPHIEEKQRDVVKGIGWGLKTIGRHHPDILVKFLKKQIEADKIISKLMIRKALTYIDKSKKLEIENFIRKTEKQ